MASDFEISRATGKCAATGREFQENEFYHAVLFESAEGFERRDYALEAWEGPPDNCVCHWKARVPPKQKKPATITVDSSILINLFCRLEDESSEMRQKFRFVLALLLMRKRLIRFEQAVRGAGGEYWQVRLVQDQSIQQVLNPHLTEAEIERLSKQLTAILSGDVSAIAELDEEAVDDEAGVDGAAGEMDDTGSPSDEPPSGSAAE